jgi:hypothetical protein
MLTKTDAIAKMCERGVFRNVNSLRRSDIAGMKCRGARDDNFASFEDVSEPIQGGLGNNVDLTFLEISSFVHDTIESEAVLDGYAPLVLYVT